MKSDAQIQKDVIAELKWVPLLNASGIGVSVKNGIVTLSGMTDSYAKKMEAEKAAKRIAGVKAVAMDVQVGVSPASKKTDTEIAEAILHALKWHVSVRKEKVKVKVEDGDVKLEGEVDWDFQRESIRDAVEKITGVRSILNLITVKPTATPADVLKKITAAFHRSASIDASGIHAEIKGGKVILTGTVKSFVEKEDAGRAAWHAPGITSVQNDLQVVIPDYVLAE